MIGKSSIEEFRLIKTLQRWGIVVVSAYLGGFLGINIATNILDDNPFAIQEYNTELLNPDSFITYGAIFLFSVAVGIIAKSPVRAFLLSGFGTFAITIFLCSEIAACA